MSVKTLNRSSFWTYDGDSCQAHVAFNPAILDVAATVDPHIECPDCHSDIRVSGNEFQHQLVPQQNFTFEQISAINHLETSIQPNVQDLIIMKQQMRTEVADWPALLTIDDELSIGSNVEATSSGSYQTVVFKSDNHVAQPLTTTPIGSDHISTKD
jgi:hypothetical protein